jgi:serine/threonine protein kinase
MFGKYALLRAFARGGMGDIVLAASGELGGAEKLCLLKKVLEDKGSPALTNRFLDEAKVAVRLNHTNLVTVFDAGRVDDELYIAMELIEGRDLRAAWNRAAEKRSRIPMDIALYIVREIARGLSYAHGYGGLDLVHRDIAPPNVLLSWHGEVKITDFGLARSILKHEHTAPGIVYGRIAYLAPEQARGEVADARSDVYATGVILWELLTGRPLHPLGEDPTRNLERARHPQVDPPSSIARSVPPSLDAVVMKALAIDRAQRFQTAEELRKAVADELATLAPGTDATRLAALLGDLFGEEIAHEHEDNERLLRDELPRLRAGNGMRMEFITERPRSPSPPPPGRASSPSGLPGVRTPTVAGRGPMATPGPLLHITPLPPPSDVDMPLGLTSPRPLPAARAAAPVVDDDFDIEGEERSLVGEVIDGRYRVERLIGTGGMGAVYEAEHVEIGKKVALKVLHPQFSRQADLVARFRREARAASKVGHPNIVDVTDSGTNDNGDVYFVMERLDGVDLGDVLRHERRIACDRSVHIGTQICRALSAAHAAGIIHRDLKPENVFLVPRDGNADFVKVLDFGIAKQDMGNQNLPRRLTTPGIAMGTPEYMAPEQAAGKPIDGRVDIYALGAILYEMLTGDPPHSGANAMEVLAKKAIEDPVPPRLVNPDVPEALEAVVMACLDRDPDARPQTMGALEYELNKSLKGRGPAVAAVLGISPRGEEPSSWPEDPAKPRLFESGAIRRPSLPALTPPQTTPAPRAPTPTPSPTPAPTADSAPLPRIPTGNVLTPESVAETLMGDEQIDLRNTRRWSAIGGVLGGLAILGGAGYAAYSLYYTHPARPHSAPTARAASAAGRPLLTNVPQPVVPEPPPPKTPEPAEVDEALSPAEIARLLEWARRTAEGGRITAPPGDNLKELLARIEKADPGNSDAAALRARSAGVLAKKGALALRKSKIDDAVESFQELVVLQPDAEAAKQKLARALRVRAQKLFEKHKLAAAISDATSALELEPDETGARLLLADAYLVQGKAEQATAEYQRVLEQRPADKRAKKGLAAASRAERIDENAAKAKRHKR